MKRRRTSRRSEGSAPHLPNEGYPGILSACSEQMHCVILTAMCVLSCSQHCWFLRYFYYSFRASQVPPSKTTSSKFPTSPESLRFEKNQNHGGKKEETKKKKKISQSSRKVMALYHNLPVSFSFVFVCFCFRRHLAKLG